MNWLPRASAWHEMQAQREKRRAHLEAGMASWDGLAATLGGLREAQSTGMAEIAAKRAAARLNVKV